VECPRCVWLQTDVQRDQNRIIYCSVSHRIPFAQDLSR